MVRARVGYYLFLGRLAACSGVSRAEPALPCDGAAGASSEAADSDGQSDAAAQGGVSGDGNAAVGSRGDLAACAPFVDQAPQPVTIRIVNDTQPWIVLGARTPMCGTPPLFGVQAQIFVDSQHAVLDRYEPATCRVACQGFLDGAPRDTCRDVCPPSNVVKLAPGEILVSEWSGLYDDGSPTTPECNAVQGEDAADRYTATREAPGSYYFHVEAGSAALCDGGLTDCGECVPSPHGGSIITGATITGSLFLGGFYAGLDERRWHRRTSGPRQRRQREPNPQRRGRRTGRAMIRSNLSCSLLLVALGACGGISRTDQVGPESAAAGSGGQSGGEFASSASAGRAAAGGSLGDLPACVPFKDQAPEPLTVKIRNDTASWIFLGPRSATCGIAPLFGVRASLTDDRGTPEVPDQPEPAGCRLPCQGLFDGNASDSCGGACAPTAVVRLGPGETVVSEWSGLVDVDEYMPSECDAVANNPWGVSCRVALREAPGSYEFHVEAGAAAMCGNGSTVCGQCLPDPRGGCTITGAIVTGDAFYGRIVVALDERDGLFGSAGGVNAASASPSRTLEVVVRDDP